MKAQWKIGEKIQNRWDVHKVLPGRVWIVYMVYDHLVKDAFVVKTLQEQFLQDCPGAAEHFRRTSISWLCLDLHPHTVHACFAAKIEGKFYLFLDYVGGGDLGKWIGTPRLLKNLPQALHLGLHLCDGMIHANSRGITAHRNLAPHNCLLTEGGLLQVTDFGLAKASDFASDPAAASVPLGSRSGGMPTPGNTIFNPPLAAAGSRQNPTVQNTTRSEIAIRSLPYLAPEQFDSSNMVGGRADIYAFGIILFEMITGRVPFSGNNRQEVERLHKTMDIPATGAGISDLDKLIQGCLVKDPHRRIPDFTMVRQELSRILHQITGQKWPQPSAQNLNPVQHTFKAVSLQELGAHQEAIVSFDEVIKASPDVAVGWASKGASLVVLKRRVEAIACFDRALQLANDPSFWTAKADTLFDLGRVEEALAGYESAIQMNPSYEPAWTKKGGLLDRLERFEEAFACHERAVQLNDKLASAWSNKSLALARLKRYDEALACANRALELDPGLAGGWFSKAIILVNGFQKIQEAMACFDRAAGLGYGPALDASVKLRNITRASTDTRPKANEININLDTLASLQSPAQPAQKSPDESPESKTDPTRVAFEQGIALVNQGKHEQGEARLEEAVRLGHPHAASVLVDMRLVRKVVALAHAGQRALAQACLDDAQRQPLPPSAQMTAQLRQILDQVPEGKFVQPNNKEGWNNMGATLIEAGKLRESVTCFMKAIDLDQKYEDAWLNLGLALGRSKEYQNALMAFDRLLAVKPDSFQGWHLKGMVLGSLQKQEEAIACYDRALKLKPDLAEAWFNKSLALGNLQKHEESVICCDRTLELNPRHLNALLQKGKALYRLGRQTEAIACGEQMNRIDPFATSELLKADAARNTQTKQ